MLRKIGYMLVLVGTMLVLTTPALAGTLTIWVTTNTSQTARFAYPDECGGSEFIAAYVLTEFHVTSSGTYIIDTTANVVLTFMLLYQDSFNSADTTINCVSTGGLGDTISTYLTADTTYILATVSTGFVSAQPARHQFDGPGDIILGRASTESSEGSPGPDMITLPAGAVVGTFTDNTVLLWMPYTAAETGNVMTIGQSLWVIGLNEAGTYYKVLLSGKPFWVPVDNIGPNYDEPWNGTPLPTIVVE